MRAIYNLKCENWGLVKIGDCPQFNLKNREKKHGTFFPEISSTMVN